MALKVWLPLNGTFENKGTGNTNITLVSGNTWAASGKTCSKSLTLTKLQGILPNSSCMSGAKEVSYAYWVKVNTAWSTNWLDGIRWIDTNGSATNTARQEFYTNCTLVGTWYKGGSISGKTFTPGVWTHIAATINYNTGQAKFYINGEEKGTAATVDTTYYCRGDFYIGDNGVDICQNDVRIYNHCLSAAEVKEISQGLVLHYKLDDLTNGAIDSSGYGHNGSTLNTVNISSDTPRYSYSTSLPNGNSMINCGRGGMVTDSITVNMWLKSSTWANPTSCTEGGGWNFESTGNYFRFPIYISGVGYKYGQSATTKAQICNNQWHMLTGVYDRINQKVQIYVDGQLDNDYAANTSNNIGYNGSNVIWIGAEATGSNTTASNGMAGLFSDYRIYCTPLSANDILQLYNTSAKVDNKQNVHAREFVENNSSIQITKQGQLKCAEINELTTAQFKKNKNLNAAEFIEY